MEATLHHDPESFKDRFQRKLAESRYFAISLVIHIVLVIVAGSIVLYKGMMEPEDFIAEGGNGLIAPADSLPPAGESPPDAVPTESFTPQTADINSPSIDVISTTAKNNTFKITPAQVKIDIKTDTAALTKGNLAGGAGSGLGNLPGTMGGRTGSGRGRAMAKNNMKKPTEDAVIRGLEWLRLNQNPDGSWGDGGPSPMTGAMSGLALLCFLGHGETPESAQYGLTVSKSVEWFLTNGTAHQGRLSMEGGISQQGSYAHGIATYALGEYFTMTKDERVTELLKQSIKLIVDGQGPDGGWMYGFDKSPSDTSVTGWQIQALKAAYLTGLALPGVEAALDKSMSNLDRVKGPNGGYGYRGPEDRYSLSGVGILCSLFWKGDRAKLRQGMEWILDVTAREKPVKYQSPHSDLYAWYYHTQAALMFGGGVWDKWNKWFQDEITGAQSPDGSWPPPGAAGHGPQKEASKNGAVYRTTLCILMLEVFYRHMPTNAAL